MGTKSFHIGDVLSVITGRLVSERHMQGIYDILNWLHQDNLFTHQLPRACRDAEPWLRESLPQFYGPDIDAAISDMERRVAEVPKEPEPVAVVISAWLAELAIKYGERFEVAPIPNSSELHRNPLEDLHEMAPNKPIIAI
jgi:hypothetical protein